MTDDASLAGRLRAMREAAGLSQEDLAERAGLSSHAISALERGTRTRPYAHTVRALCDALDADAEARAALIASVPSRARSTHGSGDSAVPRSLPVPATTLLGREADLARVIALTGEQRMVTLTGMGGVGKTRLALAAATASEDRFVDGVAYVELAPLAAADEVLPAVADALSAPIPAGTDPAAAVLAHLRHQRTLLVLDNVEHVLEVAPRIAALIEAAPGVRVLATSRAPLRIRGEVEVRVDPLGVPRDGGEAESPAADLLLERAHSVRPGWGTDPRDRTAVSALCVRLAGIPLALELAAARARLLEPAELLDRLDVAMLAGARDLPERQRSLRATLDWSYGLLTPEEQRLLRLLSAFTGGFRLEDVEGVVARLGGLATGALEALEGLVEQSLVVSTAGDLGSPREHLLEPVARYARDRLTESGEWQRTAAAHAEHFRTVAEDLAPRYRDGGQIEALARIDVEHPNLTAAIDRSLAGGDATTAARLTWALWMYWWLRGHLRQGRRLAERVLEHQLPPGVRARAELAAATMAFALDDVGAAHGWWSAALAHAGDDLVTRANAVAGEGLVALVQGDLGRAAERFELAGPTAERAGADGEWTRALSLIWLGTVRLLEGDADAAVAHVEKGLESARARGDRLTSYIALYNLSQVEMTRGDHARAREHLDEGLRLSRQTGDLANLAYLLDASAVLEAARADHARVPLLLGAAQAIRETIGSRGYGYYRPDPAAVEGAAREAQQHLGLEQYDDAVDLGRRLSPGDASELALEEHDAAG